MLIDNMMAVYDVDMMTVYDYDIMVVYDDMILVTSIYKWLG